MNASETQKKMCDQSLHKPVRVRRTPNRYKKAFTKLRQRIRFPIPELCTEGSTLNNGGIDNRKPFLNSVLCTMTQSYIIKG